MIVDSVIALGYKAEKSVVEDMEDSVKYWRDEKQVLHVPKRKLQDILHINISPSRVYREMKCLLPFLKVQTDNQLVRF